MVLIINSAKIVFFKRAWLLFGTMNWEGGDGIDAKKYCSFMNSTSRAEPTTPLPDSCAIDIKKTQSLRYCAFQRRGQRRAMVRFARLAVPVLLCCLENRRGESSSKQIADYTFPKYIYIYIFYFFLDAAGETPISPFSRSSRGTAALDSKCTKDLPFRRREPQSSFGLAIDGCASIRCVRGEQQTISSRSLSFVWQ